VKENSAFNIKTVKVISYTIKEQLPSLLGLVGMPLTFFTAAHTLLCFVPGAETALVTPQHFGYCWTTLAQHHGFLSNLPTHQNQASRLGVGQGAGRGHCLDSRPKLTKGIFHTIWHCASQEKLRKSRQKGVVCGDGICPPKHVLRPCFPGRDWTSACWWEAV